MQDRIAITYTTITVNYYFSNITNPEYYSNLVNKIYPGKVIYGYAGNCNIAKFGKDNNGKFYKYLGPPCQTYTNVVMPNLSSRIGYVTDWPSANYYVPYYYEYLTMSWGEGLGKLSDVYVISQYDRQQCLSCALKNGSLYLGEETFVGIEEQTKSEQDIVIYPNPTNGEVTITTKENTITKIEVSNYLGQIILVQDVIETIAKLQLQEYKSGIYFIKIYNKEGQVVVRKIIKQ